MNALFLTLSTMEDVNERGIYTDLIRELAKRGINVHVVFPRERRKNLPTEFTINENIKLLKVKTGNITETNIVEKGISTLTIKYRYLKAIKKYFKDVKFDLIMYSTPPITFEKVVQYLKRKHNCKTYLVLKDIFPQNAVDINMIKEGGLLWKFFRGKEKKLYEISDVIGCMSPGNVNYILKYNSYLDKKKVEVFPNSIEPVITKKYEKNRMYTKYQIPKESTLFVYGGNLGKPQGVDFLLKVVEYFYKVKNGYLLIVGSGTEYEKIRNHINGLLPNNVKLIKYLPKNEYDQLLNMADVGLVFLDNRFTIPNIPSRLTSYMEYSLPIIAATDKHTDLKDILIESKSGLWSESGDLDSFIENAVTLSCDKELRNQMGENSREYLDKNYDIRKTIEIILNHL